MEKPATKTPIGPELRARAILLSSPGIGPAKLHALVDRFGSAETILGSSREQLQRVRGIGTDTVSKLRAFVRSGEAMSLLDKDLARAVSRRYRLLMRGDPVFPGSLQSLHNGPALLWMAGDPAYLSGPAVAVIGSRRPSQAARKMAFDVGYSLAAEGYVVVSGLAYGVDAEAHRGALAAEGGTIAVLGSGLLRLYPEVHHKLACKITGSGGVISEFPLSTEASPGHFPRRNRIISGLSTATVVIEAYDLGGALITARLALDQNREVFAFPGAPGNVAAAGTNRLIQSGEAQLILSPGELLDELNERAETRDTRKKNVWKRDLGRTTNQPPGASVVRTKRARITTNIAKGKTKAADVLRALSERPMHGDELREKFGDRSAGVLTSLLRLENGGIVRRLPGGYFTLIKK